MQETLNLLAKKDNSNDKKKIKQAYKKTQCKTMFEGGGGGEREGRSERA